MLVRRDAISRSLAGDFLTLVNAEGVAEQRIVTLGPEEGDLVVVTDGLDGGELYVTRGLQKAKPGDAVNAMTARRRWTGSSRTRRRRPRAVSEAAPEAGVIACFFRAGRSASEHRG